MKKINTDKPVTLIDVFYYPDYYMFTEEFLEYDTKYIENEKIKHYPLKKDQRFILLFFVDAEGTLFTTIRNYTLEKYEQYLEDIGKNFKIKFTID